MTFSEWPSRSSVKQPYHQLGQNETDSKSDSVATEVIAEEEKAPEVSDNNKPKTALAEEVDRIDYSGAQVWKVSTKKSSAQRLINQLASEKRKLNI